MKLFRGSLNLICALCTFAGAVSFAAAPTGPLAYSGLTPLSGTLYFAPGGGALPSGSESPAITAAPITGTIENFYVLLSTPPGAGNSIVFTWRHNGVSQPVTCTIAGAVAITCSDTTHSFSVTQGDALDIQTSATGSIPGIPRLIMTSQYGPAVPSIADIQQSNPTLCYDATPGDTTNFTCSRSPSGATLTTGSTIFFRFAAAYNGVNSCINVEGNGCAAITYSDGSPVQSGLLAGDASGAQSTYLLSYDANDQWWILANQTLPGSATPNLLIPQCGTLMPLHPPTITGSDRGGTVTPGGSVTSCTIPFTGTYANAPSCVVTSENGLVLTYSTSTTSIQINSSSTLGGTAIDYACNFN